RSWRAWAPCTPPAGGSDGCCRAARARAAPTPPHRTPPPHNTPPPRTPTTPHHTTPHHTPHQPPPHTTHHTTPHHTPHTSHHTNPRLTPAPHQPPPHTTPTHAHHTPHQPTLWEELCCNPQGWMFLRDSPRRSLISLWLFISLFCIVARDF